MEHELRADNILTPSAERPNHTRDTIISPPTIDPNAIQSQGDTFDTIPPTPQTQRPPGLSYQILNSLTSTIGNMTNVGSGNQQADQHEAESISTSPTMNYFPENSNPYESSSSGELGGNLANKRSSYSGENRKRGYSASRANRSLSNASVGSGGVSLGLSLTNSTLFYDIPMVTWNPKHVFLSDYNKIGC
jgi:hypothetical protein